jgi:hypothetical protein
MEIEIKFGLLNNDTGMISVVLHKIIEQIEKGEYCDINKNGFLMNKFNNIEICNSEDCSIGQFRIMEEK